MMAQRTQAGALVLSVAALAAIAGYEGYRSTAYIPVPGDVPTIGHGTTRYEDGSAVKMGDRVTPERAQVLLRNDASTFERAVKHCAPVPMHQNEFDAAVSLAYNIGGKAFCGSTVARRFNAGDYEGACNAFLMWDKFRGRTLPGLVARRERERAMCLGETP